MLSPDQALKKLLAASRTLSSCKMDVRQAAGFVLASDVRSPDDLPRFDNSAMDGYAVLASDIRRASEKNPVSLRIIGEVHAGSAANPKIRKGCTARISTGAKIPNGADAVVMREDCEVVAADVRRQNPPPYVGGYPIVLVKCSEQRGANIRRRGEEIRRGQIALRKGTLLNAGSIAWLATMGVKSVAVHRRPRVGLLRSGNEVVEFGKSPRPYQVRDAHGVSLTSALEAMGCETVVPPIVADELGPTVQAFGKLLSTCDVILTTGGVSVGERDLFHEAAKRLGVKRIFHGIAQRPGKPIVFGVRGAKLWFGLPGNPVSALVCFYIYVRPALLKMMGRREVLAQWFEARAAHPMRTDTKKTVFARGSLRDGVVSLAEKQGSHCLGSFAEANVLVRLSPSPRGVSKGQKICCTFLPR
jgi:molybdopterin molybdotransferase